MNRIAITPLAGVQVLGRNELAAVSGGMSAIARMKLKFFARVRFLPPWRRVLLNPQPLPPR